VGLCCWPTGVAWDCRVRNKLERGIGPGQFECAIARIGIELKSGSGSDLDTDLEPKRRTEETHMRMCETKRVRECEARRNLTPLSEQ
jgi:hypothetical protein